MVLPGTVRRGEVGSNVSMRVRRIVPWFGFAAVYAFLYAPLLAIAVFAFNNSTIQALPWAGFTTKWFEAIPADAKLLSSLKFSFAVALAAVLVASLLGTWFALVLNERGGRLARTAQAALVVPVVVPGMVLGLSLAITFRSFGLTPGYGTVVLGYLVFDVPVVTLLVLSRLQRLDPSQAQAAMDLGAGPWRTRLLVVVPQIRTSVLAAALLTFTLSFDEVIVTFFLVGSQQTLPIYIWSQTRFGFTPEINAAVTVIGLVSVVLIVVATLVIARDIGPAPTDQPEAEESAS